VVNCSASRLFAAGPRHNDAEAQRTRARNIIAFAITSTDMGKHCVGLAGLPWAVAMDAVCTCIESDVSVVLVLGRGWLAVV
jgi:hypothetical protein